MMINFGPFDSIADIVLGAVRVLSLCVLYYRRCYAHQKTHQAGVEIATLPVKG